MLSNNTIVLVLREMVVLHEMEGQGFKARAYEHAADTIAELGREVADIYHASGFKGLRAIAGIGETISHHLESLITTGSFKEHQALKKKFPIHLDTLMKINGLGPKGIKVLYEKLGIRTLADLEHAAVSGKIKKLPRFGEKMEQKILKGIGFLKKNAGRFLLGDVSPIAQAFEKRIKTIPGVGRVTTAGSYRRKQETIGDIDILITAKYPKKVMDLFVKMPEVAEVIAHGPTKSSVRLKLGIQADVRVVVDGDYGAALQYFTGSKEHNVALRKIAIEQGMKLNEYGLFKGNKKIASKEEQDIYKALGFCYIEPELRTSSGELEAARISRGTCVGLPKLISYGSIKGDLQVQTNWTDGRDSIEAMVKAAMDAGLEYIAITDHTRALAMTHGLDEKRLAEQGKAIDRINEKLRAHNKKFRILKSAEVDILKNGTLDIADEALKKLDIVCIAVHSFFGLSEHEQTERIIRAMKHPFVNILFHPTGRIVNRREPYALDIDKIITTAKEYGVVLEANASERFDLRDSYIRKAVKQGAKLTIDSDAHLAEHFEWLDYGVAQARRGWATQNDVLNTLPCDKFLKALKGLKKNK